jgi:hypothetical protein
VNVSDPLMPQRPTGAQLAGSEAKLAVMDPDTAVILKISIARLIFGRCGRWRGAPKASPGVSVTIAISAIVATSPSCD